MAEFLGVWKNIAAGVTTWLAAIDIGGGVTAWKFILTVFAASLVCGAILRAFNGSGLSSSVSGGSSGRSETTKSSRRAARLRPNESDKQNMNKYYNSRKSSSEVSKK